MFYQGYVRASLACKSPSPMVRLPTHLPRLTLAQLRVTLRSTTVCTCCRDLNFSHCPDGNIADVLTSCLDSRLAIVINLLFHQGYVRAAETCEFPIAPMGFSHVLHVCSQGGGVFVQSGTVTISSSTIDGGNTATYVRAHVQNFPSPQWDALLLCPPL